MLQLRPDYFCGAMLNIPWFANHETFQLGFIKRLALKGMGSLFRNRLVPFPSRGEEYDEFLNYKMENEPFCARI